MVLGLIQQTLSLFAFHHTSNSLSKHLEKADRMKLLKIKVLYYIVQVFSHLQTDLQLFNGITNLSKEV